MEGQSMPRLKKCQLFSGRGNEKYKS